MGGAGSRLETSSASAPPESATPVDIMRWMHLKDNLEYPGLFSPHGVLSITLKRRVELFAGRVSVFFAFGSNSGPINPEVRVYVPPVFTRLLFDARPYAQQGSKFAARVKVLLKRPREIRFHEREGTLTSEFLQAPKGFAYEGVYFHTVTVGDVVVASGILGHTTSNAVGKGVENLEVEMPPMMELTVPLDLGQFDASGGPARFLPIDYLDLEAPFDPERFFTGRRTGAGARAGAGAGAGAGASAGAGAGTR